MELNEDLPLSRPCSLIQHFDERPILRIGQIVSNDLRGLRLRSVVEVENLTIGRLKEAIGSTDRTVLTKLLTN